jgi:DNA-directed RNA polymerase sigma subunit (sigma70/sigma32)
MDESEIGRLQELRQLLSKSEEKFAQLSPRERDLLQLRYGLVDGQFRPTGTIAELYGVTINRVKMLEEKAFRKLREP